MNVIRRQSERVAAFSQPKLSSGSVIVVCPLEPSRRVVHVIHREIVRSDITISATVTIRATISHLLTDIVLNQIIAVCNIKLNRIALRVV